MSQYRPSRRAVLAGAAILAGGTAVPRLGFAQTGAQAGPIVLRAAEGSRPELAGQGPLALFGGNLPGPLLRVKKGDTLALKVENALKEPLSLVWRGVRLPNALDGVPGLTGPVIAAGESRDISFAPPDAGTYFYHAFNPVQARRALSGPLVVDDPAGPVFAADHVLFIQSFPPESGVPIFPINGAISPTLQAPTGQRARLRFINATPVFLRLRVRGATSYVIAVDGQPATPFDLKDGRANIPTGGRVDLATDMPTADPVVIELETTQGPIQLAIIVPQGPIPTTPLPPIQPLPAASLPAEMPLSGAARYEVKLGPQPVALSAFPSLGTVKKGASVVLTLVNSLDTPVSVHVHGEPVRLLDAMDDGWKPWWLDTVPVPAKATVRVALLASNPGKWAIIGQASGSGEVVAARSFEVA